jgi:4-hydroxy-tetrahydrodipicolinate synthase
MAIHGVIPAMLTPFDANGKVDEAALRQYVEFLLARGVHGLFPCGTNGEGLLLSLEERKRVATIVVEQVDGRVPVIVHTGAINTEQTIELTKHAKSIGADAVGVVAPYYFPHDDLCLEQHFLAVANSVPDLPVYLYNIPGNAKNSISPKLASRLHKQCPNIAGIKDSSKDLNRLEEFIAANDENFTVIVGTDSLVFPALAVGAAGVVSAVANVFPEEVVKIYQYYSEGKIVEAKKQQYYVNKLRDALKMGPYITPYKEALRWRGMDVGGQRAPLRPLTDLEKEKLWQALKDLHAL